MDYDELVQRDIAVKKHVVEQLGHRDASSRLFQVWQPSPFTWSAAMTRQAKDPIPKRCISEYLEFPADYGLVALVIGESVSHVYASMNYLDEESEAENVILLTHHLRAGSPGDVIVPPEGTPHCVTASGYRLLPESLPS